ncbi:MAG TPA: signal peptidase I [Blastocatellia bacterium]|nr:signal peptidase I [Blastocatellia bacterium]
MQVTKPEPTSRSYNGILPEDDPDIQVAYPREAAQPPGSLWSEAKSLTRDVIFAAITAVLIMIFVVQPVKVEGTSMLPRLENDERIFVNKLVYTFDPIKRDDIVVFWYPDDPSKSFIKRVIGLPGEVVRIDHQGQLYINGSHVEEPYLSADRTRYPRAMPDTVIKPHYYFVMGDNRDASNDSRMWGLVPEKYIYGKAMFRYWPLSRLGLLNH